MMASELAGRIAIVTGGSGVIGGGIVAALAANGATVIVGYHENASSATAIAADVTSAGGQAHPVAVDVTDPSSIGDLFATTLQRFGKLDILVNNAGVMRRRPFLATTEEDWDVTMDVNVKGYFLCGQAAARVMAGQRRGVIVNVASTNDSIPSPACTAYAVAKAGVRLLTRQMALELAPLGIRTNSVSPGMVQSDFNRVELSDPGFLEAALERIPAGRLGTAADVAAAVCFLVSDQASFVNGATLRVDGGRVIG